MIRIFLAYALSGFVALGYQVVWFRLFPDWFGSTSLSFALVVCNFIGGLGAGALASGPVTKWIARVAGITDALRLYGLIELSVAVAALLTPLALTWHLELALHQSSARHDALAVAPSTEGDLSRPIGPQQDQRARHDDIAPADAAHLGRDGTDDPLADGGRLFQSGHRERM